MDGIAERCRAVRARIEHAARQAGREAGQIRIVAVAKTVPPEAVREAWAAGLREFGENRAQEFQRKVAALADLDISWHFIGHLQTNKVKQIVPAATLIHSVDRWELAQEIARRVPQGAAQPVLVQVNTTQEASKSGVAPEGLTALLDQLTRLPMLAVQGLMTIGPLSEDRDAIRRAFAALRAVCERERRVGRPNAELRELSMGMTGDFEIAIAEGATILRVGTAIFGPRAPVGPAA